MFLAKRAVLDIHQTVVVLSTRVKEPNQTYWEKLFRTIKYLNGTNKNYLTLSSYDLKVIKWYMDASFVVHPGFKSRTRAIVTIRRVEMQSVSRKQKLNTRINIEA